MVSVPKPDDTDPAEVEVLHTQIEKDIREGNGAKHFEDVLDEIHSKSPDPIDRARVELKQRKEMREFAFALKRHVTEHLLPQGLKCDYVELDDDDITVCARDGQGRQHEVKVPLDTLLELTARHPGDPRGAMTVVLDQCCQALMNARKWYFRRLETRAPLPH